METRRFTVDEYHRMAKAGILAPDERVELLFGVVRPTSPKNRAHILVANLLCDFFRDPLRGRARVYKEDPLVVKGLDSEPEPDVMICANPEIAAFGTESMEPLLVIEVAESSLLYARAGIPEYWVVNLLDREIEVFRDPSRGRYRSRSKAEMGALVSPLAWPDLELEVSTLFAATS